MYGLVTPHEEAVPLAQKISFSSSFLAVFSVDFDRLGWSASKKNLKRKIKLNRNVCCFWKR